MNQDQQPTSAAARERNVARASPDSRVSTLSAGRIALGYAVIAILWIAFSNAVVVYLKLPPAVQTIKGTVFVFVTATLLYFTIRRLVQAVQLTSQERDETRKQAEEALRRLNRELRAISNCNQVLLRATDEQSLLKEICRIVCEEAGYRIAWVGYAEHDEAKSVRPVAWTGTEEETLANLAITWADTERGRGPCGTAIRTGKTSCIKDYATESRGETWTGIALQRGFCSAIGLPLKDEHANAFGSLNIYSVQPGAFTSEEIRLLEELAGDLAFGIVTLRSKAARKQAEQQVALLSFALDKGHEAAFLIDDTARFQYVNEEACRLMGYTRAELLGLGVADIDPDFPVQRWSDHWRDFKVQRSRTFESRHRTRDGRIFPVEVSVNYFEYGDRAYHLAIMRDITERKRAEEALRENETRFRTFVDHAADALFIFDSEQGTIVDVNRQACESLGYTRQELIGTTGVAFHLDSEQAELESVAHRAAAGESVFDTHWHRRKDGKLFPVEAHTSQYSFGGRRFLLKVARDITDRKRAEEEVRNAAAQWQATFDAVQDLVLLLDKDSRVLRANRAAAEFLRQPFDKIVGGHCFNLIHGTAMPPAECPLARMRQSRRHEEVEVLARKGGPWLSVSVDPVFDQNGELTHVVHVARDITDRKRAEDALRRNQTYLAEGQRLAHMGSWAWSPAPLQTLYWSAEMFRIFGLDPQDGVPTPETFWQRIHPEDLDRTRELLLKAAAGKSGYEHDHRIVLPDGTVKHIHAIGHPVLDENGQVAEYVGTAMDVTERKLAEDELRKHREHLEEMVRHRTEQLAEAKARAEAANREKSRFLANMSHELRTPLNAVLGFSRLLKTGSDVTPHQQETLDIIVRSGEHLLSLINNVLDMAKIESGRMVLDESEVDLHQLLHEMQSLMGVGAVEKGLRFALERDPDLPQFVAVDAGKLRQVLLNLLGNALKYTDSGGVKLTARLARIQGSEKAEIRFEVADSGPGIPQEDCQRIFLPFVQVGGQITTQAGGTGLGLAICKQYVELMGGQIGIASEPGKGAVFYFSIPVRVLPSVAEPEAPKQGRVLGLAEGQPSYRLLIVEDQAENRLLLQRLLNPLGFELREAANGREAVALFEQWHPHLIWMDIRMPVMDGLEAVRRIRATKAGAATKIIALTAHALEEERKPIMAAGCDDLVRKPFREQDLFDVLARHLRLKFIYEQPPNAKTTQGVPELTVRPEQLQSLPAQLLQDLHQAVLELDTRRAQTLIAQVTERDAPLGRALNTLATQLDYKRLLKLLEKDHSQTQQTL
jgi:PAS domain S-box-containing protein